MGVAAVLEYQVSEYRFRGCPGDINTFIQSRILNFLAVDICSDLRFGKLRAWEIDRKRENSQKCLGEGAKGLLDPGSKGLRKVFCTTQNPFCTGAKEALGGAKDFSETFAPKSPKDLLHPPLSTFGNFSLFGVNFPGPQLPNLRSHPPYRSLVDVSDIFYFFSLLGEGERGVRGARGRRDRFFYCVCNPHIQESPHPRAPKSPKSLKKDFPGLSAQSVKKVSKKSPNSDFVVFLTLFWVIWDFFDSFFDTPGREAREPPFETFWGFRGSGVWRLLYMAGPIAIFLLKIPGGGGVSRRGARGSGGCLRRIGDWGRRNVHQGRLGVK